MSLYIISFVDIIYQYSVSESLLPYYLRWYIESTEFLTIIMQASPMVIPGLVRVREPLGGKGLSTTMLQSVMAKRKIPRCRVHIRRCINSPQVSFIFITCYYCVISPAAQGAWGEEIPPPSSRTCGVVSMFPSRYKATTFAKTIIIN